MGKSLVTQSNQFMDVGDYGLGSFPRPCETVKCNVAGTYRIYPQIGDSVDEVLLAGVQYLYSAVKITTTTDTAVNAGELTVHF